MTKSTINKRNIFSISILIFCLLVILANSAFFASQKSGYFLDETCTFLYSNSDVYQLKDVPDVVSGKNVDYVLNRLNTWIDYDEISNLFTTTDSGKFTYFDTYVWQAIDVHPFLYYAVVNTISSILPSLDLKWIGFIVNSIFMLSTCILIYRVCLLILGRNNVVASLSAVLYFGLSCEYTNTATYYRMYAMLAFWLVLLLYSTLLWADDGYPYSKKHIVRQCVIVFLAMLTQYFAIFYIFPIFILNLILMRLQKTDIKKYFIFMTATAVLYVVLNPVSVFHMLFTNRGQEVQSNLTSIQSLIQIKDYLGILSQSVFSGMKSALLVFLIIALVWTVYTVVKYVREKKSNSDIGSAMQMHRLLYLFVPVIFYFLIVAVITPWVDSRYQSPIMPAVTMIITVVLFGMINLIIKNPHICGGLLILLALLLFMRWETSYTPDYLYNDPQRKEFISNTKDYNAMIIDAKDNSFASEPAMNFAHPFYYITELDSNTEDRILSALDEYNNIVIYLNADCDDSIMKNLQDNGITCTKEEWYTSFYNIYVLSKQL